MGNALPDLRQTWLARRFLLKKMAELGFSVSAYLREKQMSMLDALDEEKVSKPAARTRKRKKTTKK